MRKAKVHLPTSGFLLGREPPVVAGRAPGFHRSEPRPSGDRPYFADDGDGHAIVFAPTGAGKKVNVLGPTLYTSKDSIIVLDVKGELYRETAAYRRDVLKQAVYVVDPFEEVTGDGDSLNSLGRLDGADPGLADEASTEAANLTDAPPLSDPYWDNRGRSVIAGLIAHVVSSADEPDKSFRRVWQLINNDDPIYGLAVLMDTTVKSAFAKAQIGNLLSMSADQTRSCILSVAQQHVGIFGSERVQKATSKTTVDLDGLRDGQPMTIYIVIPPHKLKSHAALLRSWIGLLMSVVLERRQRPARKVLMLLDEVAQLGHLDHIPTTVTLARGYGLRCMLLFQSYGQLRRHYPAEHDVLVENCATVATFGHAAFGMSRQMSETLGDISADRLFAMGPDEIAVRRAGQATRVISRVDCRSDPELAGRAGANPMFDADELRGLDGQPSR